MTTTILLPLLNGIALAGAFALLARAAGPRHRLWLHAAMLLVAALFYVSFAARAGAWGGVLLELAGVAAFGGVALLGLARRSPGTVALGWALHPVWDVALHTWGTMEAYTPEGWVVACIGFDLLLAGLIARGWAGAPAPVRAAAH
ncbi:MAG TPA: DUF6010 family protein [Longimicrobiaceae bacterium]|jgi:hypothetical protein